MRRKFVISWFFTSLFIFLVQPRVTLSQVNPIEVELYNKGNKIDAKFYPANKFLSPTIVLLHGFPGNADSPYGLAQRINENGINVLVFNYEGSFASEGVFSWENCMEDIGAALNFLKQKDNIQKFKIDTSGITVCGCSQGAAYTLSAAVHNTQIKKIIAVAGGNDLSIYLQRIAKDPGFRSGFEKRIAGSTVPNGPIKGDESYIHDYFDQIIPHYEYYDLVKNSDKLNNREILFITGWLDTTVPMEDFIIPAYRHLKTRYPENISIIALDTDHYFTNARVELTNLIVNWVKNRPSPSDR